ncbi:hypothetical protein DLM78_11435 [Leptospira stimsonii]|uniref:Uncharacterized protein n=1 Tax=Leptospira stimsonii TaxID=2202203 RepID=A0A8B3CR34_9LEPT|nr:hypothetical protein DLM78_11435 [Leptospira stimsonii]
MQHSFFLKFSSQRTRIIFYILLTECTIQFPRIVKRSVTRKVILRTDFLQSAFRIGRTSCPESEWREVFLKRKK